MRNLVPNLRCLVLLFMTTISLIYGWQYVTPNKAFAQTGIAVREMTNVDKIFSNFMDRWNIPGGSIAIVKDGRLVYARGFGYADKESGELVEPDHLFRIASIAKPITSIAIMKLIDDGLINVDDKVFGADGILNGADYNIILDPRVKDITVRHLMQQTSGWGFINNNQDPMFSNKHIAQRMNMKPPVGPVTIIKFMLRTQRLYNEPGTNYFYSNFGYCILGRIIESVSGKNYENYVQTELLNPLGISEMQLGQNLYENRAPNEVKYYDFPGAPLVDSVYGAGQRIPFPYGGFNIEAMDAHGGWIASASDLVRLLVAVDGYDTKPDILNQTSIQLMTTPSTANSGYGMGWAVNPAGNWWHVGDLPGTSSILVRTSNGLGWAVLFNTRPSNLQYFLGQMDNMVWETIKKIDDWPTHDLFEQATTEAKKPTVVDPIPDTKIVIPDIRLTIESSDRPPMYWINTNTGILHRLVDTEIKNLVPNVRNSISLAVDVSNEKVYWTEKTGNRTGRIRRANLDGSNVQLVKDLTSIPQGIAIDAAEGKIYLTNGWGKVQRLNIDGSNFEPNLITELDTPRGLALDVTEGKVYWTEAPGLIRRANLDGSNVQNVATGLRDPMNIAIFGDTVYWTEKTGESSGDIRFVNFRGTPNVRRLHSFSQSFPVGIAIDAVENTLYWTTSRGSVGRSNLDGSNFQPDFVTGLIAPGAFALNVEMPVDVETSEILTTDAVVSISPSPVISPGIGEQLTLNLNITAGEAVAGYQVTVQFDATALRYVESNNGDYLPAGVFFVPPVANGNRVKLASTVLTGVSNGDGTLATLTFEVVAAKASTLTLTDVLLADSEGNTVSPQVEDGEVTEPAKLAGDINNDGVVNIQDLVLVASNFGQIGENAADVNGDGVVNITDLVKVAGALGNAAAAPSL